MINRNVFLDFWRGIALLFMICFHIVYDLNVFLGYDVDYISGFWLYIRYAAVCLFIFISGTGVGAGFNRRIYYNAFKIALCALVVSVATYFFDSSNYVVFGVLHFFAVALVLARFCLPIANWLLMLLALVIVALGVYVKTLMVSTLWLLPLGIVPYAFVSVDYYPLIPWFSIFIFGLVYGKCTALPSYRYNNFIGLVGFFGKNTLVIYLVHQPIILFLLFWFKKV